MQYQDACEVVNLGSTKKNNKILSVYMSLLNMPPHIRSDVSHMHLVDLCRDKDFKEFSHEKLFSKLVADLKSLECNGISFLNGLVA